MTSSVPRVGPGNRSAAAHGALDDARLTSYADFARRWIADRELHGYPGMAIRALRQSVLEARALDQVDLLDAFHREPPSTGVQGWDALLAGVAVLTGVGRVSPGVLDWCAHSSRWSRELFDPLMIERQYVLLEMLRTPAPIRERNVILAAGNLEGV